MFTLVLGATDQIHGVTAQEDSKREAPFEPSGHGGSGTSLLGEEGPLAESRGRLEGMLPLLLQGKLVCHSNCSVCSA